MKGSSLAATAPGLCCGTVVYLTRDVLVGRMDSLVHFVTIVRGRGCEGSVFTPGEPQIDSKDRAA